MNLVLLLLLAFVKAQDEDYEEWSSQEAVYAAFERRSEIEEVFWTASDDEETTEITAFAGDKVILWFSDEADFTWEFTTSSESDTTSTEEWEDDSDMEGADSWETLDPQEEAVDASDLELAISAPVGGSVFVAMAGVAADGECELEGSPVSNDLINVVGYAGPYDSGSSNKCGVVFTIDALENHTDDELEFTFTDGDEAEVVITLTLTENTADTDTEPLDESDSDDSYRELTLLGTVPVQNSDGEPREVDSDDYWGAYVYQLPETAREGRVYTATALIATQEDEDVQVTVEVTVVKTNYMKTILSAVVPIMIAYRVVSFVSAFYL